MSLLAIEGATPTASVALVSDGMIKGEIYNQQGTGHARILMRMIDELLALTATDLVDLTAVAVTVGPGSFTGLRIGLATAQGLAMARALPVIGLSTLQVLAAPLAGTAALIVPVLNARKGEVYTAIYSGGLDGMTPIGQERAVAPSLLAVEIRDILTATGHEMVMLTGDGVEPYAEIWQQYLGERLLPVSPYHARPRAAVLGSLAEEMLKQGRSVNPLALRPSYLRLSEAEARLHQL